MISIAIKYLRRRLFITALTITSLSLAVGMVTAVFVLESGFSNALRQVHSRFPIVVGAGGSPYQLVISSLLHIDLPAGMIDSSWFDKLKRDPRISEVVPILLGHNIKRYPVVATCRDYFSDDESNVLKEGRFFREGADEAVIGGRIAEKLHLAPGATIQLEQARGGDRHPSPAFKIVGILKRGFGGDDRTIFVSLETMFRLHETISRAEGHRGRDRHIKGISALLVKPRDPSSILELTREIGETPGIQAALTQKTLSRLYELFGGGIAIVKVIMYLVICMAMITLTISMYSSTNEYRRDIAIMRAVGARRRTVMGIVFLQSIMVIIVGIVVGWGIGRGVSAAASSYMSYSFGLLIDVPLLNPAELKMLGAVLLIGTASGLMPALTAYQSEPFANLQGVSTAVAKVGIRIRMLFLIFGVAVLFYFVFGAMGTQFRTIDVPQLSEGALHFYDTIGSWKGTGTMPTEISRLAGKEIAVEGYIYTASQPRNVKDFFLVEEDPLLPHCPICYKPPKLNNMIQILTGEKEIDYTRYPIKAWGTFDVGEKVVSGYLSLYRLEMKRYEVLAVP